MCPDNVQCPPNAEQLPMPLSYCTNAISLYELMLYDFSGRSARIRGSSRSQLAAIARQAVLSGFDWVYYADQDYCRVSVIPDSKFTQIIV